MSIISRVLEVRALTGSTAVVRFERGELMFESGQYLRLGVDGDPEIRDYSIYSGTDAPYVEVLVRRIEDGLVSRQLVDLSPGDAISVEGPYGHFTLSDEMMQKPLLFIATGTGISPFRSFVESRAGLDYRLIHGTALLEEAYEADRFGDRYVHCVSREAGGAFSGRVIEWLRTQTIDSSTEAFLCGNCDMIYDAFDLLQELGLPAPQIHTEVYF
jgi:ferredoxin--NADP+ reductase/benzoate/toluate 1,2-dioxygenase reductase subunit